MEKKKNKACRIGLIAGIAAVIGAVAMLTCVLWRK